MSPPSSNGPRIWLSVAAAAFALLYVAVAVAYFFHVVWYDHVESSIALEAGLVVHGDPLYHAPEAASRYALPYGPGAFLPPAAAQVAFGPSATSTKLPGVAFAVASLILTFLAVRRATPSAEARALGLLFFCGMALPFRWVVFWVRPDPQLLFWAAVSVYSVGLRTPTLRLALGGLALGGLFLAKIHGVLFALPTVAFAVAHSPPRTWLLLPAVALATVAAPFLFCPSIDLGNYLFWLRTTAGHGLGHGVTYILLCGVLLVTPVAVVLRCLLNALPDEERRRLVERHRGDAAAAVGSVVATAILASKAGAGWYYLLPFLPFAAYVVAAAWSRLPPGAVARDALLRFVVVLYALAFVVGAVPPFLSVAAAVRGPSPVEQRNLAALAELRDVVERYSSQAIGMGCASQGAYELTGLRPALPYQNVLILESGPLMDMQAAGLDFPPSTFEALRRGALPVWILPHGDAPFSVSNFAYRPDADLYGPEFRRTFLSEYRIAETGQFYDVWVHR